MDSVGSRQRAGQLLHQALKEQRAKRYDAAAALYRDSIAAFPTAEAHTFLGWTYSFMGRLDEAIEQCRRAIEVDPDFGNPYNDIGSYLMKQGKLDEAIHWLERAKTAPRYEPRHFPYLNLARLYARMGQMDKARREFAQARFLQQELFEGDPSPDAGTQDAVN
ncbi:MAG TPA: tetratricopeptide repeat protein [Candidatus Polarisedimenticolia bacterium]|nr:tetratricopeptide repeat protein [Candidatus Polarisedimenticolia bacterium]